MQQPSVLIWKAFVDVNLCIGCGKCTGVCWTGAIRIVDKKAIVDFNRCICCAICVRTCPRGAIKIVPYSFPILQREEEKEKDYWRFNLLFAIVIGLPLFLLGF